MTVRLAVVVSSESDAGRTRVFDLAGDLETVLNGVIPTQQPSSALEARANATHRKLDGGRVFVAPHSVAWIEEIPD